MRNLNDDEIYEKAVKCYLNATHNTNVLYERVIVFLEKEIMCYRDKIEHLETCLDGMKEKTTRLEQTIGKMYGECIKIQPSETLEAVQENTAAEIIKALADNGYNTITINCYKTESED